MINPLYNSQDLRSWISNIFLPFFLTVVSLFGSVRLSAQFIQQGEKLLGTADTNDVRSMQGYAVALSADGTTAITGGIGDRLFIGAAWIFTRANDTWTQQGSKLTDYGSRPNFFGHKVALSSDGNTAITIAPYNNKVWIYTRVNGVWLQPGYRLIGDSIQYYNSAFGSSVALSGDGNTAVVGGSVDNNGIGAVWVFTRSNGIWSQQPTKIIGTGAIGRANQGNAVFISQDGNTIMTGGYGDNNGLGAVWVYSRINGLWIQDQKLIPTGFIGPIVYFGSSISLSADGSTAAIGGQGDNSNKGATWVFTRVNGIWTQHQNKLIGMDAAGNSNQGVSVSISGDGTTIVTGGSADNNNKGAAWVFKKSNDTWRQQGTKLVGTGSIGASMQGFTVAISADGYTAILGGPEDNNNAGATWFFTYRNPIEVCATENANVTSNLSGNSYQWQVSIDSGSSFSDITNGQDYNGVSSQTLNILNTTSTFRSHIYRCHVDSNYSITSIIRFVSEWTGLSSNLWDDPSNWSCGSVPDAFTDVIINTGSVVINVNAECNTLYVSPNASFIVNSGVQIIVSQ